MEELDWSGLRMWCRGRLPHWEIPGITVFLTFRLSDSLPSAVVRAYDEERRILEHRLAREGATKELRIEARKLFSERIELALNAGVGACVLRRPEYAEMVMASLRFFDGERYAIHAVSVMPNHVHLFVTIAPEWPLSKITHTWKSFTANQAQKRFGHQGSLWQDECYDHIVRDEGELRYYVQYTLENPSQAGLKNWPHTYQGLFLPED